MAIDITQKITSRLEQCDLCPRRCHVNRLQNKLGFCSTATKPIVASVFHHFGEEPIISGDEGVCNVFFAHCNLSCIYCQNHQISNNWLLHKSWMNDYDTIVKKITAILKKGVNRLGFVSPTHQVAQMLEIISRVHKEGYNPTIIYNTNAYDNPEIIQMIGGIVHVYLPDIKYFSNKLALKYSNAPEYWPHAVAALKEMLWQKGTSLYLDDRGYITSGVLVRHLVLPGHSDDSIKIFKKIADSLSLDINISLMSQYFPSSQVGLSSNLSRKITIEEYNTVTNKLVDLGFYRIWLQELDSSNHYRPDFSKQNPF